MRGTARKPTGPRTALILGAGVGGVVLANRLRKLLPHEHNVVLVDREPEHVFQPSLLWLAVRQREPDGFRRPLNRLRRKGIDFVLGEITRIDAASRTVTVGDRTITADAMIVALGADLAPETIPGLSSVGHDLYTVAGATAIRDALDAFRGGHIAVLTAAPAYKCPAAPYEAALLIEAAVRKRGLRECTQIDLYAAEPGPMGVAGPKVSAAVRQLVESRSIGYHPQQQVVRAEAGRVTFATGATADFDLLVFIPPHRAPAVVSEAGLTGETGWIPVDRKTFTTSFPGVYAIGDVVSIPLAIGKPLPKAGVFAHGQAEVVAANIARLWTGRGVGRVFDGYG
ncbi:MAG: FAD/NAD(P)-binding oxidoreductase, partial [Gemmatimonadota bacterium]|nr:FAD/NAD(P)-binding oxidoreductase [Gemmatimonadota bacterium]